MLETLQIRGLATIESLDIDFRRGFTALSGETGAGKSILIDALGMVLGARADAGLIRDGNDRADITARFHLAKDSGAAHWLAENAMTDEGDPASCLLRRVIQTEGRTRAFINGTAVPVANLRELGEFLVDIFGQNESHSLREAAVQRRLLDSFANHDKLLNEVADLAGQWNVLQDQIERLRSAATRDPAEIELLRHQVVELEALNLDEGEIDEIEAEHRRLANGGQLLQDGSAAEEALYGADNAIYNQMASCLKLLSGILPLDSGFSTAESLVSSAQAQVREAASELRRLLDRLDLDPQRLSDIEARMASIHNLARKHRVRAEQLPATLTTMREALADSEAAGDRINTLISEQDKVASAYQHSAAKLSKARKSAAIKYAKAVCNHVRALGMPNAELLVCVEASGRKNVSPLGTDDIRFDFSANPGQSPKPLAKVASGGELSRISLAIQVVAQTSGGAPTMIFDEVDAGIGGAVADAVGGLLKQLGQKRQVLCVTHLGQVAACGQHHISVSKRVSKGQTLTATTPLEAEDRVQEIARMIGGKSLTQATTAMAEELLNSSA